MDGTADRVEQIAAAASRAAGKEGKTRSWPLEEARKPMGPFAGALVLDQVVLATNSERVPGWRPRYRGFVRNAYEAFLEWAKD